MEAEELKRKLLGLWEKTTHNSKDMLAVLFDYYFSTQYIEFKESDGKIVSALCGIPYNFGYGDKTLKGLYILSLSSEEGFRKKGLLAELLNSFNDRIKDHFDFTFLIPSTALLADYFGTQGYLSSFFILEERFTPMHDFRNDYLLSLTESDDRIKDLKKALLEEIKVTDNVNSEFPKEDVIEFIKETEENSRSTINLCHTTKDLEYLLNDHSIRKLNYFLAFDSDGKITGIAFTQKEELKRIKVVANYVADTCSYYALLDYIKRKYLDHSLSVNTSDPKYQMHSIIQQTYASENPAGSDLDNTFNTVEIPFNFNKLLQPLGMVRLLRFERIIEYIAETRSDVDFKLHIRDFSINSLHSQDLDKENTGREEKGKENLNKLLFIVRNGKCMVEKYDSKKKDHTVLNLSMKEVSELLLRKNDSSNLIMEAFGIPRLNLQIRLLPC